MAKLTGSIDDQGRPLVRLRLSRGQEDLLAIIDTGFNGQLMMSLSVARLLGMTLENVLVPIELGTGTIERVYVGQLDAHWLDREHRLQVLVSKNWPAPKPDAPAALIGKRMLRPHLLKIDFDAGAVEIETQH